MAGGKFVVEISSNIASVYVAYKFMHLFFYEYKLANNRKLAKIVEISTFSLWNISTYIIVKHYNVPIFLLIYNIIILYILTYNYKGIQKNRISSACILVFMISMCEAIAYTLFSNTSISWFKLSSNKIEMTAMLISGIISIFLVILLRNVKNIKENITVPTIYWACVFIIPMLTFLGIIYITQTLKTDTFEYSIVASCILFLNILIFLLYDHLCNMYIYERENNLISFKYQYLSKELEDTKKNQDETRAIAHDVRVHYKIIQELIKSNQIEKLKNYVDKANFEVQNNFQQIDTGNIIINVLINKKHEFAKEKNIKFDTNFKMSKEIGVDDYDIGIIVGNLLENAFEALEYISYEKWIKVEMIEEKNMLLICVENPFDGYLEEINGVLMTRKKEKRNHGIGLKSVKSVVAKNGGSVNKTVENNIFKINIILFLKNN